VPKEIVERQLGHFKKVHPDAKASETAQQQKVPTDVKAAD
jgi:hypothetical protein